jgi:hypothetical protein
MEYGCSKGIMFLQHAFLIPKDQRVFLNLTIWKTIVKYYLKEYFGIGVHLSTGHSQVSNAHVS